DRPVDPAAVGVVRLNFFCCRSTQQLPQRKPGRLGFQIPERDIDRGERQVRDPTSSDPVNRRMLVQLLPQRSYFSWIFSNQQFPEAVDDAVDDEPIRRQMRMSATESVPDVC